MKKIFILFILLNCAFLRAQTLAPDFTATDINGAEQQLYKYLDDGKFVILDIFTVWCGPCWELHEQGTLKDLYAEYGPDGTDQIRIISIESDLDTGMDDLNGIGTITQGDWLADSPYITIDDVIAGGNGFGKISSDFGVEGFPAIYYVCPDRSLQSAFWADIDLTFQDALGACQAPVGANNMAVLSYDGVEGSVCGGSSFAPSIKVQNRGLDQVTSFTATFTSNGNLLQEIDWTGELGTFGIIDIPFEEQQLTPSDIQLGIISVNGNTDEDVSDNFYATNIDIPTQSSTDSVQVEILTDLYGDDTYWRIEDEDGAIVAEGGNLSLGLTITNTSSNSNTPPLDTNSYLSNTLYIEPVALVGNGCFTFYIADFFRDGICCVEGEGYYNVKDMEGNILTEGATFGHIDSDVFSYSGFVSTADVLHDKNLLITPNPTNERVMVKHSSSVIEELYLYNTTGTLIKSINTSAQQVDLDLSDYPSGIYFVKLSYQGGKTGLRKVVKQ